MSNWNAPWPSIVICTRFKDPGSTRSKTVKSKSGERSKMSCLAIMLFTHYVFRYNEGSAHVSAIFQTGADRKESFTLKIGNFESVLLNCQSRFLGSRMLFALAAAALSRSRH